MFPDAENSAAGFPAKIIKTEILWRGFILFISSILIGTLIWLLALLLVGRRVYAFEAKPPNQPLKPPQIAQNKPKGPIYAIPLLKRACSCESWGDPNKEPRQFKNGKSLRGFPNPNDVGACQINETLWAATAKKLKLNIEGNFADNVKMANYIYSKQGMNAWIWSKSCWAE